jgi:predicted transcriptional regulator YdeE
MPRFHVERSLEIDAAPEKVFETVADYGTWTTWSPWLCADPEAEVNLTPDASSVGAVYSWSGELVGAGEIEHRRLEPGRLVEDELRFLKPFRSTSQTSFHMEPTVQGTRLTWDMHGSLPFFMFWMRPQMESFISMDYDRGLKMLKELIESGRILSKTTIRGVEPIGPLQMAGVRGACTLQEIGPAMEAAFAQAEELFCRHNLPAGEAISVYPKFDWRTQTFDYISGFEISDPGDDLPPELATWSLPASKALCVEHVGSYQHLGNAWSAAHQYARYKKLKQSKAGSFELYKNNPQATPPADLRTEVYLPLRQK